MELLFLYCHRDWHFNYYKLQAYLISCDFFLWDFAVTWLEIYTIFLNLHGNIQFNVIWHRRSAAAFIFCGRLAGSDITVMPFVMCMVYLVFYIFFVMDWLCQWHSHMVHLVSSWAALAFLTNITEKCKFITPGAIQVKNPWKTIDTEEKLEVTSPLEKDEWIDDIFCGVRLAHSSKRIIHDNVDGIKESAKCLDNIKCQQSETRSVCATRLPQSYRNEPYQKLWIQVSCVFIALKINKYTVQKGIYTVYTVHIYSTGLCVH